MIALDTGILFLFDQKMEIADVLPRTMNKR